MKLSLNIMARLTQPFFFIFYGIIEIVYQQNLQNLVPILHLNQTSCRGTHAHVTKKHDRNDVTLLFTIKVIAVLLVIVQHFSDQ